MRSLDDEQLKKLFKDHVAHLKVLDEDTQTLTFKKEGTRHYQIDFVFFKNTLFVTGDLRSAVFNTTWNTSWDCQDGWKIELGYFADKLDTITHGKYDWDEEAAIDNLMSYYREDFGELSDDEFNEVVEYIKFNDIKDEIDFDIYEIPHKDIVDKRYLLQMCLAMYYADYSQSQEEFAYSIQLDKDFDDFNDFWEWGYNCGRVLNQDIELYLIALQMAYDQLSKRNEELKNENT